MSLDEMLALLEYNLGLTRSRLAIQAGVVYYKITFIFRNHICTVVRSHDGEELRFMIGTDDCGDLFGNFETRCLDLEEVV